MKPQTQSVLRLLAARPDGITALDALTEVGSFRLAARVAELRAEGYPVESREETLPNGKRVARYRLVGQGSLWPVSA